MRQLVFLLLLFPLALSMSNGEENNPVEWKEHGYMVKIVSTLSEEKHVGCTGILIAPTLVLTTFKCFQEVEEKDAQAVVISMRGNGSTVWKRHTRTVKKSADYALLQIHHRKHELSCPLSPESPRLARLPLFKDLTDPVWNPVDMDTLTEKTCRIIGFETVNNATDYPTKNQLLITMVTLEKDYNVMIARVEAGTGPCYEDYGVPLECELAKGEWTFVGMIQSILRDNRDEEKPKEKDFCKKITGMRFSLVNSPQLPKLLKPHVSYLLPIQKECYPDSILEDE